jgi:hypothetical protein
MARFPFAPKTRLRARLAAYGEHHAWDSAWCPRWMMLCKVEAFGGSWHSKPMGQSRQSSISWATQRDVSMHMSVDASQTTSSILMTSV